MCIGETPNVDYGLRLVLLQVVGPWLVGWLGLSCLLHMSLCNRLDGCVGCFVMGNR